MLAGKELYLAWGAEAIAEGNQTLGGAHQNFSRRGAEDASHLLELLLGPRHSVVLAYKRNLPRGALLRQHESGTVGSQPYSAVAVGCYVKYVVAGQRVPVGRVHCVVGHVLAGSHKETIISGAYPHLSLGVEEECEDRRLAELHLLWYHLSARCQVSHLFILAVAHLDDAVVISRPVVTFGGIAERAYVRFSLVQPVEVVLVVFKGHLCKVVRTAYPEDALV